MSIATELQNYADGLDDSYDAVDDMGGIIPAHKNMNNLDQAIRTIPQNTGITATTFHWGGSPNYSMYKDSGYTTAATYSDIATAYANGLVYIADGEDEVTYVVVSDIPDAHTITVTGIALPGYEGGSSSYTYASSTWTKTATEFQKKLTAGTNVQINGTTISATDTTYSAFTGATSSVAGAAGLVPAPTTSDPDKFLKGDGTWGTIGTGASIVTFYTQSDFGTSSPTYGTWYKDSSFTTAATGQDVLDAFNSGEVILEKWSTGSLSKLQTAFVVTRHTVAAGGGGATYHDFEISFLSTVPPYTVYCIYEDLTGTTVKMKKTALQAELTAGSNISISSNTISASVPTVNDATLTIQHNGTNVQTFSANQGTNATANIETIYAETITPTTAVATIGTTQIADAAVTSAKVDWSTMEHWSIDVSSNTIVTQTTAYGYVDVPDTSLTFTATVGGVYLVIINAAVKCVGNTTDCYARVLINGGAAATAMSTNVSGQFAGMGNARAFTATQANNTAKIQIGGGRANNDYQIAGNGLSSVQIIRIA